MVPVVGLRCVRCAKELQPGPQRGPLVELCPTCGGNLLVVNDTAALRTHVSRTSLASNPNPGLWRYLPFLPIEGRSGVERLQVGPSPLLPAPALGRLVGLSRLWLKDETRNPSASFKDRASAVALAVAHERGARVVAVASTGNAASSTACFAARLGLTAVIFVPETAPKAKVAQVLLHGAHAVAVRGTYDQAFDLCIEACQEFGWYNRNTGRNPYTREGKKTCAFELVEQLAWQVPDVVLVPVGDGNILSGLWKGFVELREVGLVDTTPRLVAVQAEHSNAVQRALEGDGCVRAVSGETLADSISVRMPKDGDAAVAALRASGGFAVSVPDEEILQAMRTLASTEGVLAEPAAAATVAGLVRATRAGRISPSGLTVAVITGSGLKDVSALTAAAGAPHLIEPELSALKQLVSQRMDL